MRVWKKGQLNSIWKGKIHSIYVVFSQLHYSPSVTSNGTWILVDKIVFIAKKK